MYSGKGQNESEKQPRGKDDAKQMKLLRNREVLQNCTTSFCCRSIKQSCGHFNRLKDLHQVIVRVPPSIGGIQKLGLNDAGVSLFHGITVSCLFMQCLVIICLLESYITICSCVIILNVFAFKHLGTVTPAVQKVTLC